MKNPSMPFIIIFWSTFDYENAIFLFHLAFIISLFFSFLFLINSFWIYILVSSSFSNVGSKGLNIKFFFLRMNFSKQHLRTSTIKISPGILLLFFFFSNPHPHKHYSLNRFQAFINKFVIRDIFFHFLWFITNKLIFQK